LLLKRKAVNAKAVVLTFDDGPGSRLTPAILNILERYNVKATFFLLGKNIEGREVIVQQILSKGHEIGSHGYEHLHYWKVSPFRALADIKKGRKILAMMSGTNGNKYPFRPPHGKLNLVCLLYLLIHDIPIIYWTLDTRDTWSRVYRDKNRITTLAKKAGGAVTLSHDFDRSDDISERFVVKSIQSILTMTQQSDLQTLTVSQLMENKK
jgi:peptidoglycan/xylan/chitin deacetylase (PgdA/CDA1 family)